MQNNRDNRALWIDNGNPTDVQPTKKTSQKHRPSGAIFASLLLSLTILTWLGGFGLPAWLVLVAAGLFIWGVARAMSDYKRLFRN